MAEKHDANLLIAALLASVLLLAVFAIPSPGLLGAARADSDDDDKERSNGKNNDKERDNDDDDDDKEKKKEFSRLFGKNKDKEKDKDKKPKVDPKGDSPFLDLDIKDYGFKGKDAYVEVYGTAGGTLGEHDEAIGYVLNIITRSGEEQTWAVDSHEIQHGDTGTGSAWHGHRVHLTDNPATPEVDATCLNEVDQVTHAMMKGKRAIFEDMKVKSKKGVEGIDAKKITSAATVRLQLQVDDPDNPPPGTTCIALVVQVYDTADLTKRERND
ncbi:MAG: hypothetical protein QXJ74_00285 [Nitrososphaera sp.]